MISLKLLFWGLRPITTLVLVAIEVLLPKAQGQQVRTPIKDSPKHAYILKATLYDIESKLNNDPVTKWKILTISGLCYPFALILRGKRYIQGWKDTIISLAIIISASSRRQTCLYLPQTSYSKSRIL
jgi:hypothetical protein